MENVHLREVKICVDDLGTLFAVLPSGAVKTILVDVHDLQHYGALRIDANAFQPAHWILNKDGSRTCSECGHNGTFYGEQNFCPNCGAKIELEDDN